MAIFGTLTQRFRDETTRWNWARERGQLEWKKLEKGDHHTAAVVAINEKYMLEALLVYGKAEQDKNINGMNSTWELMIALTKEGAQPIEVVYLAYKNLPVPSDAQETKSGNVEAKNENSDQEIRAKIPNAIFNLFGFNIHTLLRVSFDKLLESQDKHVFAKWERRFFMFLAHGADPFAIANDKLVKVLNYYPRSIVQEFASKFDKELRKPKYKESAQHLYKSLDPKYLISTILSACKLNDVEYLNNLAEYAKQYPHDMFTQAYESVPHPFCDSPVFKWLLTQFPSPPESALNEILALSIKQKDFKTVVWFVDETRGANLCKYFSQFCMLMEKLQSVLGNTEVPYVIEDHAGLSADFLVARNLNLQLQLQAKEQLDKILGIVFHSDNGFCKLVTHAPTIPTVVAPPKKGVTAVTRGFWLNTTSNSSKSDAQAQQFVEWENKGYYLPKVLHALVKPICQLLSSPHARKVFCPLLRDTIEQGSKLLMNDSQPAKESKDKSPKVVMDDLTKSILEAITIQDYSTKRAAKARAALPPNMTEPLKNLIIKGYLTDEPQVVERQAVEPKKTEAKRDTSTAPVNDAPTNALR